MKLKYFLIFSFFILFNLKGQDFELQLLSNSLSNPVEIAHANDDRLFIVEKAGKIKIFQNSQLLATLFLNITNRVNSTANERGLLGLAFSPNFANDHYFYVHYSNISGNTTISRFTANANVADPNSEEIILTVNQPFSNHNGGKITFGNDGYLYIGLGDGGSGGDPYNNAQNKTQLLGKLLRIDVSSLPYTIPDSNPYAHINAYASEIYSLGLRNPWKFSFDSDTGDLWIADVGQNAIEEINHVSSGLGLNFGWRCYEGTNSYNLAGCSASSNYTFPVNTYIHTDGRCSITGGYVYRGSSIPELQGKYVFGDYCSGDIGVVDAGTNVMSWVTNFNVYISSFGVDTNGELYLLDNIGGSMYKFVSTLEIEEIEEIKKEWEIHINNPVFNILKIISSKSFSQLILYDTSGREIKKTEFNAPMKKIEWDLSSIKNGVYLLELKNELEKITKIEKLLLK